MTTLLNFSNIHLQYQNGTILTEVIKGISFVIHQNERLAIVGKSGSGKTSLLMLMAGLEKPTSGQITYQDRDITSYSEDKLTDFRKKNIGIVFQSFYLIPNLTALENVLLSLEANQQYGLEKDAENLLTEFGLSHRMHHLPSELSGGEQQRVAIARALINKPKIILADEPTGNLDSANSESMIDLLFDYTKKSNTSLVMVTHDSSIAKRCDRIIEIRDGQIV